MATTTVATIVTSAAGRSRRTRRTQNEPRLISPVSTRSVSSNDVMRKPESVKNAETPRNPPRSQSIPAW